MGKIHDRVEAASIAEARQLYQELSASSTLLGANFFSSAEEIAAHQLEERRFDAARKCRPLGLRDGSAEGRAVFAAPSPWHALAMLYEMNRDCLDLSRRPGRRVAFMFRGQRNPALPLLASIHRPDVDRTREAQVMKAFVRLMERTTDRKTLITVFGNPFVVNLWAFHELPESERTVYHVATGQHFGIKSRLLDFTTDPDVAAWFACQGAPTDSGIAAILAVPFTDIAQLGTTVVLPHSDVNRLYRQRGVFVLCPPSASERLKQCAVEIQFPADPTFQVMRDGSPIDLLSDDPWWEQAVECVRRVVETGQLDAFLDADNQTSFAHYEDPLPYHASFLAPRERDQTTRSSLDGLIQILLSLAVTWHEQQPYVSDAAIETICNGSWAFLRSASPHLRQYVGSYPPGTPIRQAVEVVTHAIDARIRSMYPIARTPADTFL